MKIAGLKNNGAWYRANKFIASLDTVQKSALLAVLDVNDFKDATFNDLTAMGVEVGVDVLATTPNVGAWMASLVNGGIPNQVWLGHLSFTTYQKVILGPIIKYTPNYQTNIAKFAKRLRRQMSHYMIGFRKLADLTNLGNRASHPSNPLPNASVLT